ncbi:MAG: helix-turn-helix domain-containing protein [Thermodesulfobacteriota bacterium]
MQTSYILSFGRYLKAIRESRNMALSTVADQLRVSIWHLMLIEAEDHEKLPDEVYVKGTLKAYAETVGVDPADIIERYEINRQAWRRSVKSEQDLLKSGKQSVFRMMVALGALASVVVISIVLFDRFHPLGGSDPKQAVVADREAPLEFVLFEQEIRHNDGKEHTAYTLNDRLHLKLVAVSETQIRLRIDDGKQEKLILNPRDEMQVEASERFILVANNPQGVNVYFNGKPVDLHGNPGEPVSVLFRRKITEAP